MNAKHRIASFWNGQPCGTGDAVHLQEGSREYFDLITQIRYQEDDFMPDILDSLDWRGKRVLEIGCGVGTDFRRLAASGATVTGIDLTSHSISLAKRSLELYGLDGSVMVADAEDLPFPNHTFDCVYSWGVIHHAPDPAKVVSEITRVLKPNGEVLAMLYNVRSLFALQVWMYYGVLHGRPFAPVRSLIAGHVESAGSKAYTSEEVARLFSAFQPVRVQPIVTRYDLRIARRLFLPGWVRKLVPKDLGWFLVVHGRKS